MDDSRRRGRGTPVRSASDWLRGLPPASPVQRAAGLLQLQRRVAACLPPALSPLLRVGDLHDGLLTLVAPNGTVAHRARAAGPRLCARLRTAGLAVQSLSVQVLPESLAPQVPVRRTRPPGPDAVQALERLAEGLEEGPLREALARMARHQRPPHG